MPSQVQEASEGFARPGPGGGDTVTAESASDIYTRTFTIATPTSVYLFVCRFPLQTRSSQRDLLIHPRQFHFTAPPSTEPTLVNQRFLESFARNCIKIGHKKLNKKQHIYAKAPPCAAAPHPLGAPSDELLPGTRRRFFSFPVNPASRSSATSRFPPGPRSKGGSRAQRSRVVRRMASSWCLPRPPPLPSSFSLTLTPPLGFESAHLPWLPILPPSYPRPSLPASARLHLSSSKRRRHDRGWLGAGGGVCGAGIAF